MSEWKQACWLAMFEVKSNLKGIITLAAMAVGLSIFFTLVFSISEMEDVTIVYDIFFVLTFWVVAASFRPKEIQLKKMNGGTWASPYFVMLNQLPITKNVLVMSRFIGFFIISIPFNVLVLTLIYALSTEFREAMPITTYIVFSIIWLCIGFTVGSMFPASDVGEKMSMLKLVIFNILFYGALLAIYVGIFYVYGQGVVAWTMHAAREWPQLSIAVSLLIAIINFLFAKGYIYKKIDKIDYLV
ncbi:hypothetical protein [Cytobacillus dafuensis]|uniref:ABC-2 transporter permease n=1 Tax=Cytobacillus dafuensis TaxID=1742359 RepID=A0A5B8Z419_CYTDA|nr:hypothetical protein [Cytobacillus dafuensis]QED46359.1 hypothetical protein FSZ17_03145 [Cytobacillus dafuensis]